MQKSTTVDLRVIRTTLNLAAETLKAGNYLVAEECVRGMQFYLNTQLRPLGWVSYQFSAIGQKN